MLPALILRNVLCYRHYVTTCSYITIINATHLSSNMILSCIRMKGASHNFYFTCTAQNITSQIIIQNLHFIIILHVYSHMKIHKIVLLPIGNCFFTFDNQMINLSHIKITVPEKTKSNKF